MLTKNRKILNERENIEKKKDKMILNFPELFSKEELHIDLDNKNKLKQHNEFLLDYIKTQYREKKGSIDTKKKLEAPLKQLLK